MIKVIITGGGRGEHGSTRTVLGLVRVGLELGSRTHQEAGEGMHSSWGQGSLQASQDPQATPDASQDPHSGREEEGSGLRGSM